MKLPKLVQKHLNHRLYDASHDVTRVIFRALHKINPILFEAVLVGSRSEPAENIKATINTRLTNEVYE